MSKSAKKPAAATTAKSKVEKKAATKKVIRDEIHRVYRLDEQLRERVKAARAASGLTVRDWLAQSIAEELPALVAEIKAIRLHSNAAKTRPARLCLSESIIATLKQAAGETSFAASRLLLSVLSRAASAVPVAKAKRGRKPWSAFVAEGKTDAADGAAPKAKRGRKSKTTEITNS